MNLQGTGQQIWFSALRASAGGGRLRALFEAVAADPRWAAFHAELQRLASLPPAAPAVGARPGPGPLQVFISYSGSEVDASFRDELIKHLKPLQRAAPPLIALDAGDAEAGQDPARAAAAGLDAAHAILLLVTADYLASDVCWDVHVAEAMRRHDAAEARVIPVIVRSCNWQSMPFHRLKPLPSQGKPVDTWDNRDSAWLDVAQGLARVVDGLRAS